MHHVVVLALDGVVLLDVAAPAQVFGARHRDPAPSRYEFELCSVDGAAVPSVAGFDLTASGGLERLRSADTVIVPGYERIFEPLAPAACDALVAAAGNGARMVSICTGAFALGHAGLLNGHAATTHWAVADELQSLFPSVDVRPDVLYVDDGTVLTSGGIAAGIDLCLHIVLADHGAEVANAIARRSVVAPHRSGNQAQFVEHPLPEVRSSGLAETLAWAQERLAEPITVSDMAAHAGYSVRSFCRRFRAEAGTSAWQWIILQRILLARRLLETSDLGTEQVASSAGFSSAVAFRKRFREFVGTTPSAYRAAFGHQTGVDARIPRPR
jgi:AraC family transcriptional activator FtrA